MSGAGFGIPRPVPGPPRDSNAVRAGQSASGHIFNLGHGVLPTTDPTVLTRVVEHVHAVSARS